MIKVLPDISYIDIFKIYKIYLSDAWNRDDYEALVMILSRFIYLDKIFFFFFREIQLREFRAQKMKFILYISISLEP